MKTGGYQAIVPVARKIAECEGFMGAGFSYGDTCILEIADRKRTSGIAPTWKGAAFCHHLAMAAIPAATLLGRVIEQPIEINSPSTQLSLLTLLETS